MKSESPASKTWKRFCKNRLSLSSLLLIGLAVFIAVFCYTFMPDSTPLANRINLTINNQAPGFRCKQLLLPKAVQQEIPGWIPGVLNGKPDRFDFIPVSSVEIDGDYILYREYGMEADSALVFKKHLLSLAIYLPNDARVEKKGDLYQFVTRNGNLVSHTRSELLRNLEDDQLREKTFILGTDRYGRDMLSRLLAGTRVTFGVGLIAVIISLTVGLILGSLAGYFGGRVDSLVVWLINVIWSIPTLLLVISITLVLGKGFEQVFIAVGLTMWVDVARIVRGQLFSVRELEFATAGKAMGFGNFRIMRRHLLPNILGPVLVVAASNFSTAILLEAGLSFLGIGAQPPTPSWGAMIKENYGFIIIPGSAYLAILPGLAIFLLTMAFTFVANGLRDAMDSRQQIALS